MKCLINIHNDFGKAFVNWHLDLKKLGYEILEADIKLLRPRCENMGLYEINEVRVTVAS